MSRASRHKEKHDKNGELSQDNCYEGTAARTRPFSFDEIMLRRKNKGLSESVKEGALESVKASGDSILDGVSDNHESGRGYNHHKDSPNGVEKVSRKEFVKVDTKKKDENPSKKEDKLAKQGTRETRALEIKSTVEMRKDINAKAKGMIDMQTHCRIKIDERSRDGFENEVEKKHLRSFTEKNRPTEGTSGKSEREREKKYRNVDDEKHQDRKASKRHELVKGHDLAVPVRKGRKESSKFRHEDVRNKRRRSRSQDHEEDRNRRSISLSPRAHKRTSYYGREHGELSSHSLKTRSGRRHSDIDRSRMANNGSSSHFRRHSGSTSGLGGYSPRKRRADVAVKTPSPTNRSPEKKSAKWDLGPAGAGIIFSGPVSSDLLSAKTASPVMHEMALNAMKPVTGVSYGAMSTKQSVFIDSVQLTQATRPMRRLYVENVPASVSEKALMECFNNLLLSSGSNHIQGTQPCISCIVHKEKGQAFVEFLTPEDASAALSFDGCSFAGTILKISRPKDFVEVATGQLEKSEAEIKTISDTVKDSPHKIFIGGISKVLSSEMLMEIATVYGPLKAYHFEINEDLNTRCAFLEYVDQSITLKACAGLNGMKFGGQVITAVQAFPTAVLLENSGNRPFYGIPEHAKPLLEKPTQVLKLKNVFNLEGFSSLSEHEVQEILEDVRFECARFGTVKSINVVKYGLRHTKQEASEVDNARGADSDEVKSELEALNQASRGISGVEIPSNVEEDKEMGKTVEGNDTENRPVDPVENGVRPPCASIAAEDLPYGSLSEAISVEPADQLNTSNVVPDSHDEKGANDVQTKHTSVENNAAERELDGEDLTRKLEVALGGSDVGVPQSDPGKECNLDYIFEPGCVFVEYGRTEASCMAAHCLHGRLFDDQIVSVEYVPLDHYRAKFPK